MKKWIFAGLLLTAGTVSASVTINGKCYEYIWNPFTGTNQYVNCAVSSTTLPSGSTQYIQNTLTPTTTTQQFNINYGIARSSFAVLVAYSTANVQGQSDGILHVSSNGIVIGGYSLNGTNIRQYRIGINDPAGSFNFYPTNSTTAGLQFILQNFSGTNYAVFSNLDSLGSLRFSTVNSGSNRPLIFTAGEAGGQGYMQFGRRPSDNSSAVGSTIEIWPLSGSSFPAFSVVKAGAGTLFDGTAAAYRFYVNNDGSIHNASESSTTNSREIFSITPSFSDSTDSTRKGQAAFAIADYNNSARTYLQANTDGTAPYTTFTGTATFNDPVIISTRTLAQLQALTPGTTWQTVTCIDCANTLQCISTGTVKAGWAALQAANRITACQ